MTQQIKQRIEQIRRGEVPEGYKKTKVGIIPDEWKIVKLDSISSHVTKKNSDGKIQTTFTNSATQGVIRQTDYFDKEISNRENITGYYIVQEDDYIYNPRISTSAPCGPINKSHFAEDGVASPLYTVFKMKGDLHKNRYIEYYLKSSFWHRYMCGVANYGARHDRMNITNDDLFGMPILFPTLEEQQKIAEILSAQDKLIALKEKLIEEKKRQKKALMQQLLTGKKSLPGFSGEWEKKKIKDICIDVITGNTPSKKDEALWNGKFPWITSQDFCGKYINQSSVTLSPMGKEQCRVVPAKSVLITCIASIGLNAITNIECATNQQINAIVCASEEMAEYVYYYMELHEETMKRLAGKTAVPIINKSQFENFPIIFPHDKAEMKKIVECLSAYDKEIELLDMQLNQEKQKKKALMQLLLTGIVRV